MAFEWLERFQRQLEKHPRYAERTLAAYRLGLRARGAIAGVAVSAGPGCCEAARGLEPGRVYDPAAAPVLPLAGCTLGRRCPCVYRPVMTYQRPAGGPPASGLGPPAEPAAVEEP